MAQAIEDAIQNPINAQGLMGNCSEIRKQRMRPIGPEVDLPAFFFTKEREINKLNKN